MTKIFVIDTNILLNDPNAILSFEEHDVVIPMTVLEELDSIKDRKDKNCTTEARIAINNISNIVKNSTPEEMKEGVQIPSPIEPNPKGKLSIFPDHQINCDKSEIFINSKIEHQNDNRIINVALHLQDQYKEKDVVLISADINMMIKAKGSGLRHTENYRKDQVIDDIDVMTKGHHTVSGAFWDDITSVQTSHDSTGIIHQLLTKEVEGRIGHKIHINEYILDSSGFCGQVTQINEVECRVLELNIDSLMNMDFWGISPKNTEQALACHALANDDSDLTILTGPAGSGKTLLAIAYGVHAVLNKRKYDKIIYTRNLVNFDVDIGALPGDMDTKLAPWLAAAIDSLEVLHAGDESPQMSVEYVIQKANFQFTAMNYMRGRSFSRSLVIVDESQSLSQPQMIGLASRLGEGSRLLILGNLKQIETNAGGRNTYVTAMNSGLTYLAEKAKSFDHSTMVHINAVERSRLAAFVEDHL